MSRSRSILKVLIIALCCCVLSCTNINTTTIDQQEDHLLETHNSLKTPLAGAVELMNGNYQSVMFGTPCPFRVFSPVAPKWSPLKAGESKITSEGMRLVVYVVNLKGIPRPSAASDRAIMEDLIKEGFLVVAVDFGGGRFKNHLEFQKDINALFCVFGGEWHSQQSYFTENRKKLLEFPSPNKGMSFTSFDYSRNGSTMEVPVNRAGIYVIPSGYTVETHLVFKMTSPAKAKTAPERACSSISSIQKHHPQQIACLFFWRAALHLPESM